MMMTKSVVGLFTRSDLGSSSFKALLFCAFLVCVHSSGPGDGMCEGRAKHDFCMVNYNGKGTWYPATYVGPELKDREGYVTVIYDDTPNEHLGTHESTIFLPPPSETLVKPKRGQLIWVNYKRKGVWYPATYVGPDLKDREEYVTVIYHDAPGRRLGAHESTIALTPPGETLVDKYYKYPWKIDEPILVNIGPKLFGGRENAKANWIGRDGWTLATFKGHPIPHKKRCIAIEISGITMSFPIKKIKNLIKACDYWKDYQIWCKYGGEVVKATFKGKCPFETPKCVAIKLKGKRKAISVEVSKIQVIDLIGKEKI